MKRSERHAAKMLGHLTYFNGKPCRQGHVSDRQTVNGSCCECGRIKSLARSKRLLAENPEEVNRKRRENKSDEARLRDLERSRKRRIKKLQTDLENQKKYYLKNSEIVKARSRARHHADLERASLQSRKWREENPDKVKILRKRSKAARKAKAANVIFEPLTIFDIIKRDGKLCYICGIETDPNAKLCSFNKAELEHVIAISCGGNHTSENLRCACFSCNRIKGKHLTPEQTRQIVRDRAARSAILVNV